jgi:hypothetical protein
MKSSYSLSYVLTAMVFASFPVFAEPGLTGISLGQPVQLQELDKIRGQGGVMDITNVANLEAILADNDASNSVTGSNSINGGSFTHASGVFSIIQNTGNNVIIQDSTIITVTINPEQ